MLKDLVNQCRSYRRFYEDVRIPFDELKDMVDTARVTGSQCPAVKPQDHMRSRPVRQGVSHHRMGRCVKGLGRA